MKFLRYLHLYMGCLFAPMLLFFAISGIWQTLDIRSPALTALSTIHTSGGLKLHGSLSSPWMKSFVILAAISFTFTVILGIILAFRYGRFRPAIFCLVVGLAVPITFAILFSSYH